MAPDPTANTLFKREFGHPPVHEVRAPVGLVLLGRAAEHGQGLALTAAIDKHVHLALAPRSDGKIELIHNEPATRELFWVSNLAPNTGHSWADVVKSVLRELRHRGVTFSGFNAAIRSEIGSPFQEAGSLPASLAVATALGIRRLYPFSVTETGLSRPPQRDAQGRLPEPGFAEKLNLARLCSNALPTPGAFVETATILGGKAWHLLSLDLREGTVEHLPMVGEVLMLSVPESTNCQSCDPVEPLLATAARTLRVKSLRSVEPKNLENSKALLPLRAFAAAKAAVNDNLLAVAAERALRLDDHAQFGHCLAWSDENWRAVTGAITHKQRLVLETARAGPGCLASIRLPQFPRAILHIVRHHQVPDFEKHIADHYKAVGGGKLSTVFALTADGAR